MCVFINVFYLCVFLSIMFEFIVFVQSRWAHVICTMLFTIKLSFIVVINIFEVFNFVVFIEWEHNIG